MTGCLSVFRSSQFDWILASSNLTSSGKVSRATEGCTDVERRRFFIDLVKCVFKVHSSGKFTEVIE